MFSHINKATFGGIVGAVLAFLTALQAALPVISASEWIGAVIAALVAAGAVGGTAYAVPNTPRVDEELDANELPEEDEEDGEDFVAEA